MKNIYFKFLFKMVKYIIYIRSESTYLNNNGLNIWEKINDENNNFEDAKSELILNGKRLTEEFYEKHHQGCAFHIIDELDNDLIENYKFIRKFQWKTQITKILTIKKY